MELQVTHVLAKKISDGAFVLVGVTKPRVTSQNHQRKQVGTIKPRSRCQKFGMFPFPLMLWINASHTLLWFLVIQLF